MQDGPKVRPDRIALYMMIHDTDDSGCSENVVPTHWVPLLCIVVDHMYLVGNHFLLGGAILELLS